MHETWYFDRASLQSLHGVAFRGTVTSSKHWQWILRYRIFQSDLRSAEFPLMLEGHNLAPLGRDVV
jgi:hypothetical protein